MFSYPGTHLGAWSCCRCLAELCSPGIYDSLLSGEERSVPRPRRFDWNLTRVSCSSLCVSRGGLRAGRGAGMFILTPSFQQD